MKIVLNGCYGGFSLSEKAMEMLGADSPYDYDDADLRFDSRLIEVVEELGDEASGEYADLYIVDLPDDITDYRIVVNDGIEEVIYVVNGKIHIE